MYSRRHILGLSLPAVLGFLAGCQGDFSSHRKIDSVGISVTETDGKWNLTVELRATLTGSYSDLDGAAFHDVNLIAYSKDGSVVANEGIGDIPGTEMEYRKEIEVECTGFPYFITYEAEESVCDDETSIEIAIYDENEEWWEERLRECSEELPPSP